MKQAGTVAMNYAYNGRGEQVRKHVGSTNIYTLYDEGGHWLGDYDDTGTPLQQALWMDDLPVGLLANGNQLHYIEPDHLGTPRVVIEVARNVPVWTWDVKGEAFGNTAPDQNPDGDAQAFVLDMRFPGQRFDAASGLNYNYFRDYDAGSGRYVQSDPIGLNGGISTYSYAGSQPFNAIDPLGLSSLAACANPANAAACAAAGVGTEAGTGGTVSASAGAAGATAAAIIGATSADSTKRQCEEECEPQYKLVRFWLQDVKDRFWAMRVDKLDLFRTRPTGTMSWAGHQQQFKQSQGNLRAALQGAESKGCLAYPLGSWTWATMPPPDRPFPKP